MPPSLSSCPQVRTPWLLIPLLWMLMGSALIFESDAYRYASILLVGISLWQAQYLNRLLARDWLALLCWGWGGYAIFRFGMGIFVHGERGTSEWLYAFPLLFPPLGAALYATREYLFKAVAALVSLSAIGLTLTNDFMTLMSGGRTYPLFHNNPIHAAVACGMLLIISIFWTVYISESGRGRQRGGRLLYGLGLATALLCLVGVFGARSKGVWLALVPTSIFVLCTGLVYFRGGVRLAVTGLLALVFAVAAYTGAERVRRVAGPTIEAADNLSERILNGRGIFTAIQVVIKDPETPTSTRERLELWTNAAHVIQSSPWIGSGNVWLQKWRTAPYPEVRYHILHNGYLEILVRHGIFGLIVLSALVSVAFLQIQRSMTSGDIPRSVGLGLMSLMFFFLMTIMTNSNNRLAIGESLFLVAGAALFALRISEWRSSYATQHPVGSN